MCERALPQTKANANQTQCIRSYSSSSSSFRSWFQSIYSFHPSTLFETVRCTFSMKFLTCAQRSLPNDFCVVRWLTHCSISITSDSDSIDFTLGSLIELALRLSRVNCFDSLELRCSECFSCPNSLWIDPLGLLTIYIDILIPFVTRATIDLCLKLAWCRQIAWFVAIKKIFLLITIAFRYASINLSLPINCFVIVVHRCKPVARCVQ